MPERLRTNEREIEAANECTLANIERANANKCRTNGNEHLTNANERANPEKFIKIYMLTTLKLNFKMFKFTQSI
jgi:hypothetical protein